MLCLAACQRSELIASRLAQENPIMPVRMTSDTTHVVLTDYLPALYGDTSLWKGLQWTAPEALECLNLIGTPQVLREMDLVNRDRGIHAITFHDKSGSFAIPVLPNKPVRPSLISLSYADDQLRVGFCDSVANPTFEAYIQNMLIDHNRWSANEDGSWTLDISNFKFQNSNFSGRTAADGGR